MIKELNLPEFTFLDGSSHLGDTLKGRTLIFHIRTASVIEDFDDIQMKDVVLKPDVVKFEFKHRNYAGFVEKHTLVIHYSLADKSEYEDIFRKTTEWYSNYMAWEDRNIEEDSTSKHN